MLAISGFARDQEQAIAVLDSLDDACFAEESISVLRVQARPRGERRAADPPLGIGEPLGWFPGLDLLCIPGIGPIIASGPALSLLHGCGSTSLTALLRKLGFNAYRARSSNRRLAHGDILLMVCARAGAEVAVATASFRSHALEEVLEAPVAQRPPRDRSPSSILKGHLMHSLTLATACIALLLPGSEGSEPPPQPVETPASAADLDLAQRMRQAVSAEPDLAELAPQLSIRAGPQGVLMSGALTGSQHRMLRKVLDPLVGMDRVRDEIIISKAPDSSPPDPVPRKEQELDPAGRPDSDAELQRRIRQALIDDRVGEPSAAAPQAAVDVRSGVVRVDSSLWKPQDRARLIPMISSLPGVTRVEEGPLPPTDEATARFDPELGKEPPKLDPIPPP